MTPPSAPRRVAVVTGGASGMGLSIAEHLVRRGDRVALFDADEAALERATAELGAGAGEVLPQCVDVADRASVQEALDQTRRAFGGVTIMVTSAAVSPFQPFTEITPEAWDRVLAINLTGTFHCLQAVIPDMIAAGWGRIVTISSSAAQIATPNHAHYAASKGGVVTLTRAVALEYARQGITANVIAPHMIDTPMFRQARAAFPDPVGDAGASRIPLGRLGTGDDIAATCLFLLSDEAEYFTGQVLGVNGGAVP